MRSQPTRIPNSECVRFLLRRGEDETSLSVILGTGVGECDQPLTAALNANDITAPKPGFDAGLIECCGTMFWWQKGG